MKWFEGTIPEAIRLSKTRQSLFVVYVAGMFQSLLFEDNLKIVAYINLWHSSFW